MNKVLLLITVIVAPSAVTTATDYCTDVTCTKGIHTMCKFKSTGPSTSCKGFKDVSLTRAMKESLLNQANENRNDVATGKHAPHPSASNMVQLVWNGELGSIARRWALQCLYKHDNCRNTKDYKVGQNIANTMYTPGQNKDLLGEALKMDKMWFDEIKDCTTTGEFPGLDVGGKQVGHYTQYAWATTLRMGCEIVAYKENSWDKYYLVCNYGPAGNMMGDNIYKTGSPCSACPADYYCSSTYSGLCTKDEPNDWGASNWNQPLKLLVMTMTMIAVTTKHIIYSE